MEHDTMVPIRIIRDMDDKEIKAEKPQGMMTVKVMKGQQGDINKLAEAFITNFRNQLTFQRDEPVKYHRQTKV
ncbi:hypothetical protein PTKIN_Ptkin03bG0112900 [Pterospermum kingtungense]